MENQSACPVLDVAELPMSEEPAVAWETIRGAGDVFRMPNGDWCVTGLDAIRYVYSHPEIFSNSPLNELEHCPVRLVPEGIDPPEHQRFRGPLNHQFAPKAIEQLDGPLRAQARELVGKLAIQDSCEIVEDLAKPFPAQAFLTMLGLPLTDRDYLVNLVRSVQGIDPLAGDAERAETGRIASDKMVSYLSAAIAEKRREPTDDLLSYVVTLREEPWNDEDILGFGYQFTLAGLDTVASTAAFAFRYLATHADIRRQIVADPAKTGPFVEEILRLENVSPFNYRRALVDVDVAGHMIPAGALVQLALGTANRDPERFPNPEVMDLTRKAGHLAFGSGIHRCIGSHLARRELKILIDEFHLQIPDYELADEPSAHVVWPALLLSPVAVPLVFRKKNSAASG